MAQLTQLKCEVCRVGSPTVTDQEIAELHPQVPEWKLLEEDGTRKLQRVFRFPDFVQALVFTNTVGILAESEGHHPRIVTEWGRVTITWWTHKIRGLHRNDFIMAARTDRAHRAIAEARPAADAAPEASPV